MSFLLGGRRGGTASTPSSATSYQRAHAADFDGEQQIGRGSVLYDIEHGEEDAVEVDDELEAAFAGQPENNSNDEDDGHNNNSSIVSEGHRLLDIRQQDEPQSYTSTTPSGGYDFERDPYERGHTIRPMFSPRMPSTSGSMTGNTVAGRAHPSRRRQRRTQGPSSRLFGVLRNVLPTRLQSYGLVGNSGSSREPAQDFDLEEEELDDWDAPPAMLPGTYGGGGHNDGVFSNLMAKPGQSRLGPNGEPLEIVGGDDGVAEKEIPPAYDMAVLDSAPPYFDTTIHAPGVGGSAFPGSSNGLDDMLIEGLPVGNIFSFLWSLLVSMSFQFVGFLLTTLLATSHASKNGSRAGLGITLIQYGLFLQSHEDEAPPSSGDAAAAATDQVGKEAWNTLWGQPTPTAEHAARSLPTAMLHYARTATVMYPHNPNGTLANGPVLLDGSAVLTGAANSWLAMVLMILGWFLLVSSTVSYIKALRYAKALRDGANTDRATPSFAARVASDMFLRVTGREWTTSEPEWGLASRPAPASSLVALPTTVSDVDLATPSNPNASDRYRRLDGTDNNAIPGSVMFVVSR